MPTTLHDSDNQIEIRKRAGFPNTRWSLIQQATDEDVATSAAALDELCKTYWFPLYTYCRRSGKSPEDSEDHTQRLFESILQKDSFKTADKSKGRLRSFLLSALRHHMSDSYDRDTAEKRGGKNTLTIDLENAEKLYAIESKAKHTPKQAYEKRWTIALLDQVLSQLQEDYAARGSGHVFEALRPFLSVTGDLAEMPLAEVAQKLSITEGNVKVRLYRLRKHYRTLLRNEIGKTVESEAEIDEEIRHLFSVFE